MKTIQNVTKLKEIQWKALQKSTLEHILSKKPKDLLWEITCLAYTKNLYEIHRNLKNNKNHDEINHWAHFERKTSGFTMGIHMLAKLQKLRNSGPLIICNILKKSSLWFLFFLWETAAGMKRASNPRSRQYPGWS